MLICGLSYQYQKYENPNFKDCFSTIIPVSERGILFFHVGGGYSVPLTISFPILEVCSGGLASQYS